MTQEEKTVAEATLAKGHEITFTRSEMRGAAAELEALGTEAEQAGVQSV